MLDFMRDIVVRAVIVVRLHNVIIALTLGRVRRSLAYIFVRLEVVQRGLSCRHRRAGGYDSYCPAEFLGSKR